MKPCVLTLSMFAAVVIALSGFAGVRAEAASTTAAPTLFDECQSVAVPVRRSEACTKILSESLTSQDKALALYFRALSEVDQNMPKMALSDLDQAVSADENLWVARWARARVSSGLRNYDVQIADYSDVIQRFPDVASAWRQRGAAHDSRGDTKEAIADFNKAIELSPPQKSDPGLYLDRGIAYDNDRQIDKAIADFGEAIRRDDHDQEAYAARGRTYFMNGKLDSALADFDKIGELRPRDTYYLLWLYLTELKLGKSADDGLRRRAEAFKATDWPVPIIHLLLGVAKRDDIATPNEPVRWAEDDRKAGMECEIDFYLGEQSLIRGDRDKAKTLFEAALATHVKEYVEYRAAALELERMK